jgi:hypothetical protein
MICGATHIRDGVTYYCDQPENHVGVHHYSEASHPDRAACWDKDTNGA